MKSQQDQYEWQKEQSERQRKIDLVHKYLEKSGNQDLRDIFEANPDKGIEYIFGVEAEKAKPKEPKVVGDRLIGPGGEVLFEPPPPDTSWMTAPVPLGGGNAPATGAPAQAVPGTAAATRAVTGDISPTATAPAATAQPQPVSLATGPDKPVTAAPQGIVLSPARQAAENRLNAALTTQFNMLKAGALTADAYSDNINKIYQDANDLYDTQATETAAARAAGFTEQKQASDIKKQGVDTLKEQTELKRQEWAQNPTPEALAKMGFTPEVAASIMTLPPKMQEALVQKQLEEQITPKEANLVTLVSPDGKKTDTFDTSVPADRAAMEEKIGKDQWTELKTAAVSVSLGEPKLTEIQTKGVDFYISMKDASQELEDQGRALTDPASTYITEYGGIPGKYLAAPEYLSAVQSRKAWLTALNYHRSGANLAPFEYKEAKSLFFPEPGDEKVPGLLEKKSRSRLAAELGLYTSLGPAKDLADKALETLQKHRESQKENKVLHYNPQTGDFE
jgi:hypothetical protein